jgi:hypothetical protein
MSCVPAKVDGQGVGSSTTYLRRYSLAAVCGIAQEDDDGNSSAHTKPVTHPLISSGEAARIKESIESLNIDEAAFLRHYGVKSIGQLTTDKVPAIDKAFIAKNKANGLTNATV